MLVIGLQESLDILELKPNFTLKDLTSAYKKQVRINHVDQYYAQVKDLPQEQQDEIIHTQDEKMKKINAAKDYLEKYLENKQTSASKTKTTCAENIEKTLLNELRLTKDKANGMYFSMVEEGYKGDFVEFLKIMVKLRDFFKQNAQNINLLCKVLNSDKKREDIFCDYVKDFFRGDKKNILEYLKEQISKKYSRTIEDLEEYSSKLGITVDKLINWYFKENTIIAKTINNIFDFAEYQVKLKEYSIMLETTPEQLFKSYATALFTSEFYGNVFDFAEQEIKIKEYSTLLQITPEQLKQDYKFSCKYGNFEGTIYDYLKTKLELKEYSDLLGTTPENLLVAHYKNIANKKGFKSDIFDYVLHEVIKKCSKITGKSVQELTVEYAKHYDIGKKNSDTIKTFKKNELKTHVMSVTIEAMNTSLTEITEAYILFQTEGYAGTIETYILQTFDAYQQGTTIEELFKHQYEYLVQNGYNKSYAEYLSHISTPKKEPIKSEEKSYYKSAN